MTSSSQCWQISPVVVPPADDRPFAVAGVFVVAAIVVAILKTDRSPSTLEGRDDGVAG